MVSMRYFRGVGEFSRMKSMPLGVLTSKIGTDGTAEKNRIVSRRLRNISGSNPDR